MVNVRSQEEGVSEIVGSMLLIAVVVAGVSIVGIALLSQPLPQNIPSVNAVIWNDTSNVYIKHDGGDALANGTFKVYVNGVDQTLHFNLSTIPTLPWTTWSVGNILQYNSGSTTIRSVQIVWTGKGNTSSVVLSSVFY
jgi:FlaG/FlaF family flagellin (archaellin)